MRRLNGSQNRNVKRIRPGPTDHRSDASCGLCLSHHWFGIASSRSVERLFLGMPSANKGGDYHPHEHQSAKSTKSNNCLSRHRNLLDKCGSLGNMSIASCSPLNVAHARPCSIASIVKIIIQIVGAFGTVQCLYILRLCICADRPSARAE